MSFIHHNLLKHLLLGRHEKSYIPSTMTTLRSENFRKSVWFATFTNPSIYMRFYYHKQPLLHSILLYNYYTLILSYISVISLFVSFVFKLGYIFPQSHDMCRISFNSYLNFCIQKSGMSATKFQQSLIFSVRIPHCYPDFSHVCEENYSGYERDLTNLETFGISGIFRSSMCV